MTTGMSDKARLVIAARKSPLSMAQASLVEQALKLVSPGTSISMEWLITEGDRSTRNGFAGLPTPGVFEREVDSAVLEGRADAAVHSLKDIPTDLPKELEIVAALPRGPAQDILVGRGSGPGPLEDLGEGVRVGTSSVRRQAMVRFHAPLAKAVPIRGNVGTRIEKLERGDCDVLILAEAGFHRLSLANPFTGIPPEECPPAPGQGIIAVVALKGRMSPFSELRARSQETWAELVAERAFLKWTGGGCSKAVGGYMNLRKGTFTAAMWKEDGSGRKITTVHSNGEEPEKIGIRASRELKAMEWEARK